MSDVAAAIMDAPSGDAEGGFSGFSFREIAADVGVKISSVHYHSRPRRISRLPSSALYRTDGGFDRTGAPEGAKPVKVWVKAFRGPCTQRIRMCPCAVLGASTMDLPLEVSAEVKKFFKMCHEKLVQEGLSSDQASQLLARSRAHWVVANAVNDFGDI